MIRRCAPSDWMPGLLHGERTLREVRDTLPGIEASSIPWIVRFFENPASRWALLGATTLFHHDCLHILLGRGLNPEDEAFVLGYTMGQSDGTNNVLMKLLRCFIWSSAKRRALHYRLFCFAARHLYPAGIGLSKANFPVYWLGVGCGETATIRGLETFPFESHLDDTIESLRARLHIDVLRIEAFNRFEQLLSPNSDSARLDIDAIDHSHLTEDTP